MSDKIRVLLTDPVDLTGLKGLSENPRFELLNFSGNGVQVWRSHLAEAQCWLVRSETRVSSELLEAAPNLKVVGRAGVGVDNIDVPSATRRGILVLNVPGANTIAAAEHAWGLLLSLARNIAQADASVKQGEWDRKRWMGTELQGKTLGIVGLGRIGTEVAKRGFSFGMRVLSYDPYVSQEYAEGLGVQGVGWERLLQESDFLTLHAAANEKTRHLLGRQAFAKVKPGILLINCARGELIEEVALVEALEKGQVKAAALDVFEQEPLPADSPLRRFAQVVLTPHLGASTREAQVRVSEELARSVVDFFEKGALRHAVNLPGFSLEVLDRAGPYLNLAERLGRFLGQVVEGGMRELSVHCRGDFSPSERRPLAVAVLKGLLSEILNAQEVNWVNALSLAQSRGVRLLEQAEAGRVEGYSKLLSLRAVSDSGSFDLSGAVLADQGLRVVRLGELSVDVVPEGKMLVLINQDQPGMIGQVGTLLGSRGINISDMRVGRAGRGQEAIMVITVDQTVPNEVLEELRSMSGIHQVKWVEI
ncbi:MAG: phosphoglycerate dehydrogenase [Elusimicrobia bacterium]|nr:phosphoglycerate dehydrogenase [Elusimicrobiota bacterium]